MCWIMCTEYRYSSAMSCIGQSVDSHMSVIIRLKVTTCLRVTTCPGGATCGPITRTA